MKTVLTLILCMFMSLTIATITIASDPTEQKDHAGTLNMTMDQVLDEVEKIYTSAGFPPSKPWK